MLQNGGDSATVTVGNRRSARRQTEIAMEYRDREMYKWKGAHNFPLRSNNCYSSQPQSTESHAWQLDRTSDFQVPSRDMALS